MKIESFKIPLVRGSDGSIYKTLVLPSGSVLRNDGFFLIADSRNGQPTVTQVPSSDWIVDFDPYNGPDAIQLLDGQGHLLDAIGYGMGIVPTAQNGLASFEGTPAPGVAAGHSLERKSPSLDTDNNAADFMDQATPTPGK